MSGPISPELQSKIASWRLRAAAGELTLPEMQEAIVLLRAGRMSAASAAATAKRSTAARKTEAPSAESMLDELDGI